MKIIYYRLITYVLTAALLYPDIVLALPNTLHPNSAFDADPRNNKARSEMIEYLSVKSTSDKVYKEARLAQRLYEMGYVEGTGEENKYIRPTRELLKLWEDAMTKELSSVFVKGYLIKLDKLGKNWEVARISNQTTGEEEVYQFGVYQRTEVKVVKDKGKAPPAVKKKEAEDEPQKPGLMQQILIAFSQLARPTLRELMEFIRDEWGTETDEKGVLTRIGFLNFRRRKAGQKELVLVSEEEKAKEMEEPEPAEPAKPKKPLRSVKPTKPARPPKPEKPPKPASPPAKKDKGELLRKLAELNWNLKKFHDYITAITGRKKPHFLELLRELDLAEEFKKRCREVYIEKRGVAEKAAEYFGITSTTFRALVADFEIDLDIPETEEQKEFSRIVLSYAEELKKGTPIEEIKEKLGALVEGFKGWEMDAEEGEIKTKFMGNNTLVMGALEDKRYRIVFEWHVEFGLVVILKEPGRDDSEDIVYDLSNCRDLDSSGQHKKINALWRGKRKDFKGRGLNRIIERYTRLLKEERTLPQIKEELLKQIEEFGGWEIEVARRTFAITPIYGSYNNLIFDRIPSGKLFLKLQWDDLIGLVATFGKSEEDVEEDLVFDVSIFSGYDESATRDELKNNFAKKIGVRDELNRARLNKVILRYVNLLRAGEPLEQIKEEMALPGSWKKTIEGNNFTTTPVINNVLGFQNIPKGTYEISLEWLDPIGLVAVFHKEGEDGSDDLLYDINPYKDYNESAEKSTHINARKLGVRKIITAAYLEGLGTIARARTLGSGQGLILNYLGEIILKYIDYLREGKPLEEINGLLAEDIEKFGIRELELKAKSFTVSPVKLNSLLFLGLTPCKYYISVFWHDEYGLLVGLKPQDESDANMKAQIYDVRSYKDYGAPDKERKQLCASIVTSRLISIIEKQDKTPQALTSVISKEDAKRLLEGAEINWNLMKFHDHIAGLIGRKRIPLLELLRELDLADEFKKRCREVYIEKKGVAERTAEYFGIKYNTLRTLIVELGIDLDIPETEEQKGFSRIVLGYAEELKKGTPIGEIKEKLGPLVERFSGWEVDAEGGEIKTKFMGNNTLVIGALEDKRYKIVFEWHVEFGLVVVLKEPGKDIGEDIIYDLSNCRDFDSNGQYKKINALKIGKRKDIKGLDFNRIIERYARLLKEGKSLYQIKEILLKSVEEFGIWELEKPGRSFITTPIRGSYNKLGFDRLPQGKLFLRLQWNELVGLVVVFGKQREDSSEDLLYDPSPYAEYDESATDDNPKNIFARKIGARDELNRARLNKVILRYADLLRAGRPLEEIREEIMELVKLLGGWRKDVTGVSFTTTPVNNNTLHVQSLPKGTYDITLEWIDFFGMALVFSKGEDRGENLIYSINNYKDYDVTRESFTFINATKLGERKWLPLRYLEKLILRYTDYLKEEKSLDEIRWILAGDMEIFAVRELELGSKTFWVDPVKGNRLYFRGPLPGQYYVTLGRHKDYGLIVTLIARDKGNKTQVYYISKQEDGRFNVEIVTSKVKDMPTAQDVIDLEGQLFLKNEIREGTRAKLGERNCIIYGSPVLLPDAKLYLQFTDGKIEGYTIREIIETLQIYSERQRKWLLLKGWVKMPEERAPAGEGREETMEEVRYPTLTRLTRLRDPHGRSYILLGRRYKDTDEVLLAPDNTLVLKPEDGGEIVRVLVKDAVTAGWEGLEVLKGPTHSKSPKDSEPFSERDKRELVRMNKDARYLLLSQAQPGLFSAVKKSIRAGYVLGDGQEIRIDRRKLKDIKIIYGGTDSLDILNFGFRVNEKIGFAYYELDKKTGDVTVVLPFLFFASVFRRYMDLKEEHYFAGKRKVVKVRKWEQDIPIAILRQAVLHEMAEARNPKVDEHSIAEAVEVSDTIILEEKMRARYKRKGMDYPYSDLVKKTMGGTPLSLLDQEIDEVCPVRIEKGDVIRLWEKCKWDLDSLRQELGISGIGFRMEGIERMPGVEESIVADSYIAFIRGVGIEEEFKKKLIEVFRKKKKQTKREKKDCLSELAMFFGLYATQEDVLLKIMLRLDIEDVLKEIIGMGRKELLKRLETHRWDSDWLYNRFIKRLNEWGFVNIVYDSPGKVIEALDLIDFYRDRKVMSRRWWSRESEHRKFVDEHVGRTRAEVEEYFDKLFRKWNYSIGRAREYSLKNLYVPGKANIFKIIRIFRLEGIFKRMILRFWQENDFNNLYTANRLDIGSTVIGSLMAASGISDLSVLTGVGSVDYLKKRLKKLRREKLIGVLEEGRRDAQEAFRELIKEGVLDKYLRLFGLRGTYRLIYRIFKEKLSEEELYSLMRNYLVSLDLGDVEKGFGRERREFSFVSAGEIEIPRSVDRTELDILTDEVITSVYKNLIRDPRFLERLKEESQNEQNPEPLREAYARAYRYYKDAIGFEVNGLRPDVVLRLFQKIGVKFLIERKKAVLADEMGTGKTIQAIAACLNIPGVNKVLVIVPNSAKDVWEREIRTKTRERAAILRSGKREEFFNEAENARFLVVNYEAIGRKDRTLLDRLKGFNFDVIIYDEAHKLRNENLYWKAVKEFKAEYEFGLTGTPLVGRDIMKSFNLNHKLYPERFPSRRGYKAKYSYSRREADVERVYYRIRQYHTDVKDFTLRRLKRDVLPDLPPKRFITVPVRLSPEHREAYERIYRNFREWLNQYVRKEKRPEKPIILSKYLRLKQAAIDLSLVEERDMLSAKYEELDRLVETILARGEKVLVYSTYVEVVDKLRERYKDRGVCCLKGGMTNKARLRQIDMFQSDPHKRIMVSTFTESVTLTAANNVIFIDKPWTAQDRDQAIDRVHRFGQTRPVNIYTLLAIDTVDERTERILREGEVLFKLAIEDFGDVSSAEEEVISGIMKEEKEVKNLVDYLRDRYAEFQRISEARKRGVKSFSKMKQEDLSIYIDDKGVLVMSLEREDGAGIKIIGFKELLQAAGTLSSKSKGLINEFFKKRLEYETAGNISIKDSFLWPLFVELVPVVGQIDFHGQLEFEVELSVYVIFSLINNQKISPGDLLVQKYKSDIDLNKVLYMLDRYNIFKALSELGVLSSDFYYLGNILDYKHPSQSFSLEAMSLYHDKDIVSAMGMAEIRLAREANKGNVSARDAIISANLWLVKEVADKIYADAMRRVGRKVGDLEVTELISEGNGELVGILGDYLKKYKEIGFSEYARPLVGKAISKYIWARVKELTTELRILDVPVFEDDERETRKDRLVYTGEAEEVDEEPELIRLARERLAEEGFSNEEIEIFLKSVAGYETDELAIEYSRDTAEIEEIIQRARETLAKVKRLKEAVREAVPARREVWVEGDYGVTRKEEPEEAIPVREPRERTRGEPFARQKTMIRLQKAKDFLLAHSDLRLELEAHPKRGHIIKLIIEHRIMNMDKTQEELGQMVGVTKARIGQIEKWILDIVENYSDQGSVKGHRFEKDIKELSANKRALNEKTLELLNLQNTIIELDYPSGMAGFLYFDVDKLLSESRETAQAYIRALVSLLKTAERTKNFTVVLVNSHCDWSFQDVIGVLKTRHLDGIDYLTENALIVEANETRENIGSILIDRAYNKARRRLGKVPQNIILAIFRNNLDLYPVDLLRRHILLILSPQKPGLDEDDIRRLSPYLPGLRYDKETPLLPEIFCTSSEYQTALEAERRIRSQA